MSDRRNDCHVADDDVYSSAITRRRRARMLHKVSADRAVFLAGDPRGLTTTEVIARRERFGSNDIVVAAPSGWRDVARDTARDPMIWFLAATASLFAWLGDYVEASILAAALVPIIGMDTYLHRRTQASTEGLAGRLAARARVMRDGVTVEIPAREIVPGDVVIVAAAESFPADGVLIGGTNLQADESALTGEALPVRKRPFDSASMRCDVETESREVSIEHDHWAAAGTRLLTGEAHLRVVFTGSETLYGEIVRSAQAGAHERTPLQKALTSLVIALLVVATILCVALGVTRYLQGHGALDALLSAVTLAVAALPEEFPVVFAFFLSVGVYRLARRQALVRRAVVVENIGRVTCICSDKTGTLTEGRLRLTHVLPASDASEDELLHIAAFASRRESADPMDRAIRERVPNANAQRIASFPFGEDRRREVNIVRDDRGRTVAAAKGAPETILGMTALSQSERDEWLRRTIELASSGHKVIACACLELSNWPGGEPDRDYVLLGLLAFADPLRATAAEAVKSARDAGIRVIMVTGDHPATARAIAKKAGIGADPPRVIEGADLVEHLKGEGDATLGDIDVVARCMPSQKLDLVRALRAAGEIVAVTGDGVNDVPALQGADIGIVVGERGTRSAREVASIVLLDDNFRTIIGAISEGRQLFRNLKLSFAYLIMVHIPLVLTAALIPFAGYPLLYLPAHIVWLELIIHPTALLVFPQVPSAKRLEPIRRRRRLRFFDAAEWAIICGVGLAVALVIVIGYVRSLGLDEDVEHARSMAIVSLIAASAAITLGLGGLGSRSARLVAVAGFASAVVFVQMDSIARLLHLSALHAEDWLIACATGAAAGVLASLITRPSRARDRG